MAVTFNNDILYLLGRWRSQMIWRLDLQKYEGVKMNAQVIYEQLENGNMPPPNIATFTPAQIQLFY
jgi:hypothetical protein